MPDTSTLTLPVLPLPDGVVLPGMVLTIALETDEARAAVEAAGDDDRLLLVPRVGGRHPAVGTVARIESRGTLPSGTPALVVRAVSRARLRAGVAGTGSVLWLEAEPVDPATTEEARELAVELRAAFRALFEQLGGRRLTEVLRGLDEPGLLADAAGWWPDLALERKVELLETVDVTERVRLVLAWVKEALAEVELAEKIRTDVSEGMEKTQREFLLRQQLAAIRKELGEDGDADDGPDAYRAKLAERDLPEAVRDAVERELSRLERTSDQSPEQGWIRTWLDTIFELPWGERSADHLDLARARAVLDADHTGLDEVKERIVEELAIRKLRHDRGLDGPVSEAGSGAEDAAVDASSDPDGDGDPSAEGQPGDAAAPESPAASTPGSDSGSADNPPALTPRGRARHATILTLVGPPGVGKTSLGESIARALGRRFVRVALGGVRDEAAQ